MIYIYIYLYIYIYIVRTRAFHARSMLVSVFSATSILPSEASPGKLGLSSSVCFRSALSGRAPQRGRAISSAPAQPSGLERPSRAPHRGRAGSSGHLERPSEAERARAALVEHAAAPGASTFRACWGSGASSSGHVEAAAAPGQVLSTVAVFRVGFDDSCGVSSSQTEPDRAELGPAA